MFTIDKIPPDSLAGNYLRDRGIDLHFASCHGALWTFNKKMMEDRLGVLSKRDFDSDTEITHRDWNDYIFAYEWSRNSGLAKSDFEKRKRQWKPQQWEPGQKELLSFPIHDSPSCVSVLLPIRPEDKSRGKRTTRGSIGPIFIPEETWEARQDSSKPIFLTEGPVKTLALLQAGVLSIGLNGTWVTERIKGSALRQLMRVLRQFEWRNREVYLAFDADQRHKTQVRLQVIRNFLVLTPLGAVVRQLTGWTVGEGKGIDDYLYQKENHPETPRSAAEALGELIEQAKRTDFVSTLVPADLALAKRGLYRVKMDEVWFSTFVREFARKFKISRKSFGKYCQGKNTEQSLEERSTVIIPRANQPCEYPVTPSEVLERIRTTLLRFVWMKPSQSRAVTLHIVLHSLHDAVDKLPILLITSPEEDCGKSTLLKLIKFLSNRAVIASNISPAAIYRVVEKECPTLLLDEADTYMHDNEMMRGIIDSGHDRVDAVVIRADEKGNLFAFSTWCPKVIAMIGLPKRTILSRSIPIRLQRKPKSETTERLRNKHFAELEALRREIARLVNDIRESVASFEEADFLDNRASDNWEPLLAIASQAGEEWKKSAVSAALKIQKQGKTDKKEFNPAVLEAVGEFFAKSRSVRKIPPQEKFFVPTDDLLSPSQGLNSKAYEESLWWTNEGTLTAHKLGRALGAYGIHSKVEDIEVTEGLSKNKRKQVRGYWSDIVEDAVSQYVSS